MIKSILPHIQFIFGIHFGYGWKPCYELLEDTTDRIKDAGDVILRVIIANA